MVLRIFNDPVAWVILAVMAVLAFVTALIFKNSLKNDKDELTDGGLSIGAGALIGLEAVILAMLGGLIARAFISLLMGAANDSAAAGVAVGWGFFLVPGIVGTIPFLTHSNPLLTDVESLLMFATVVGGMAGAVNGLWRIYDWEGLGWIAFPLDVTWALAGNTVGCLLHVLDFIGGDHDDKEHRPNAHQYKGGFPWNRFAHTQGAVSSHLDVSSSDPLYKHEMTHVLQDRGFGPIYTLTYLGWVIFWVVPSIVFGMIKKGLAGFLYGPMAWCYFNNPWELWGYKVQATAMHTDDDIRESVAGDDVKDLVWPAWLVILFAVPFFAAALILAGLTVKSAWIDQPSTPATKQTQQPQKTTKPPTKPQPPPPKPKH